MGGRIAGERVGTVVQVNVDANMSMLTTAAGRRKPKEVVYPIYVLYPRYGAYYPSNLPF